MNAANQITLAQIILVPIFLYLLLNVNSTWQLIFAMVFIT